jgi:hypothetical protein
VLEHNSGKDDQGLKELLKQAYKPETPSKEFRERLQKRMAQEAQMQASRQSQPAWRRPLIFAPLGAAALALVLALVLIPLLTSTAMGTLEIRITDAPKKTDEGRTITEINVNVTKIEVHKSSDGGSDNGTWITVIEGSYPFDLLSLEGVQETIGSKEVPAGKYTQMRIEVVAVNAVADGEEVVLKIPSDTLKIVNPPIIEVSEDGRTVVVIDFDLAEDGSIVDANKTIIVSPVIKLEVTQED